MFLAFAPSKNGDICLVTFFAWQYPSFHCLFTLLLAARVRVRDSEMLLMARRQQHQWQCQKRKLHLCYVDMPPKMQTASVMCAPVIHLSKTSLCRCSAYEQSFLHPERLPAVVALRGGPAARETPGRRSSDSFGGFWVGSTCTS